MTAHQITHPIHYSTFVLFVKTGNEFDFTSIKDLYGKKIMRQAGFSIGGEFGNAVREKKIFIQDAYEFGELFLPVINGISDAFVNNLEVTLYKLRKQREFQAYSNQINYLPKPVEHRRGAYLVLSKKSKIKDKIKLAEKITDHLIKMENDGTYLKIQSKY